MATYELGVRRFRDELRRWLTAVQAGDDVLITERGLPIARVIGASALPPAERLRAAGVVITPPARPWDPDDEEIPRVTPAGSVADLVAEQRR